MGFALWRQITKPVEQSISNSISAETLLKQKQPAVVKPEASQADIDQEAQWIAEACRDAKRFKPLYEKYHARLYHYIYHKVTDAHLAADLTQQVFLKAMLNIKKYRHRQLPFSAWLYRIAINESIDFFRKSKKVRQVVIDEAMIGRLHDELTEPFEKERMYARLKEVLGHLNLHEVQLLELRFYEAHTFKEIGQLLNLTENNAKVKTYRLLDKLRKLWNQSSR